MSHIFFSSRRLGFRVVTTLTMLCFLNLEFSALTEGEITLPAAHAQGKVRRVALFVMAKNKKSVTDAQVLQMLLRQELKTLVDVRLVTGAPDPQKSLQGTVAPLLEEGFRAVNDRDHTIALSVFTKAYDALSQHTGALERRLMARTLKGLGIAQVMAGKVRDGQQHMAASLAVWPDQSVPEYGYTLDVLNSFKTVVLKKDEAGSGSIAVVTELEGATVSIDGKMRGYSPLTISDLSVGLHWVQIEMDGYFRSGSFVEVKSGDEKLHRFAMNHRDDFDAYEETYAEVDKGFRRKRKMALVLPGFANLLGADEVLVLKASSGQGSYELKGWHQKGSVESVQVSLARDANFLQNLQQFATGTLKTTVATETMARLDAPRAASVVSSGGDDEELFIDPDDPILKSAAAADDTPLTSKWWFWTIIGGVVAGVTVGAVLLFSESSESKGPVGDVVIDLNGLN